MKGSETFSTIYVDRIRRLNCDLNNREREREREGERCS